MTRTILASMCALLLSACTPELIPLPISPVPAQAQATPTAASLEAPTVVAPHLVAIHMLDERNGWGVNDTAILRTLDGGYTWYNVSPKGENSMGYAVNSEFLDMNHAWILVPDQNNMLAGSLYRTLDGGTTWTRTSVPFGGGYMHFLNRDQGWMMASLGAGAGSMGVAVFQTIDGGANWTQTYTNDPNQAGAGNSLPLGGLKDGLAALDLNTAWIGGITYTPGVIYLYSTQDGGHNWTLSPVKIPDGYSEAQFETTGPIFANPSVAYLPVHVSSQNGVMLAVYLSRDRGKSWILSPSLIPMGGTLDVISPDVAVAWNGTSFYVTLDGAQTWSTTTPDVRFSDSFSGMDFVNQRVGYVLTNDASGNYGLYSTQNGGATWSLVAR